MSCPFAKFASLFPISTTTTAAAAGITDAQLEKFESIHGFAPPLPPSSSSSSSSSASMKDKKGIQHLTLSEALRVGTSASHRAVEKSKGVSVLLQSVSSSSSSTTTTTTAEDVLNFDRVDYVRFNVMLACIYIALEAALHQGRTDPLLAPLFEDQGLVEELVRSRALLNDVGSHLETIRLHLGVTLEDLAEESLEECLTPTSQNDQQNVHEEDGDDDVEDPCARQRLFELVDRWLPTALQLSPARSEACTSREENGLTRDHVKLLKPVQVKSVLKYVQTLLDLAEPTTTTSSSAGFLLSHAYTRYLGDLSGGQHIVRKVSKRFAVDPSLLLHFRSSSQLGFEFYHFSQPTTALKARFRVAMEAGFRCVSTRTRSAVTRSLVDEANRAFDLNTALFESLLPKHLRMSPSPEPQPEPKPEASVVVVNTSAKGKGGDLKSKRPVVWETLLTAFVLISTAYYVSRTFSHVHTSSGSVNPAGLGVVA